MFRSFLFFAVLMQSCISGFKTAPVYISNNDKINFIFNMIDINPKDAILNYKELYFYQYLTEPQLPLTPKDYKLICNMLGANWRFGLSIHQFNKTYYIYELGTNLDKDYTTMRRLYESF